MALSKAISQAMRQFDLLFMNPQRAAAHQVNSVLAPSGCANCHYFPEIEW